MRLTITSLLCALSDALFHEFRVHILTESNLFNDVNVHAGAGRAFSVAAVYTSCLRNPWLQSLHSRRSNAERDNCLSGNYIKSFNSVTLVLSQNVYQKIVLISTNYPYFFHVIKNVNITSLLSQVG